MQLAPAKMIRSLYAATHQDMKLHRRATHLLPALSDEDRASALQAAGLAWSQASTNAPSLVPSTHERALRLAELACSEVPSKSASGSVVDSSVRDKALQAAQLAWHAHASFRRVESLDGSILQIRPYASAHFMVDSLKRRRCKLCPTTLGPKESPVAHYWGLHGLFCLMCGGIPAGRSPAKGYGPEKIVKHWKQCHGMGVQVEDVAEAIGKSRAEALLWRKKGVSRARATVMKPDTTISARHGEHYKRRLSHEHECTDGRKRHGIVHAFRALFADVLDAHSEGMTRKQLKRAGFNTRKKGSSKQKPKRRLWQIGKKAKGKKKIQQAQTSRLANNQHKVRKREGARQ